MNDGGLGGAVDVARIDVGRDSRDAGNVDDRTRASWRHGLRGVLEPEHHPVEQHPDGARQALGVKVKYTGVAIANAGIVHHDVEPAEALDRRSHQRGHVKVKPTSALAARAAQEYVYVGEDLRQIARVGISMLVVMAVLWLVIVAANVFGIY